MTVFDIATKVINKDQKIWVLHAGRGRRFLNIFIERKIAFLELPGFLANEKTFESTEKLRQHVRMSHDLLDYHRSIRSSQTTVTAPSRNPNSYSSAPGGKKDKWFNSAVGNAKKFYSQAKVGDLLIVPGRGQYERFLMGEFIKPFDYNDTITLKGYEYGKFQVRPIKWIEHNHQKRELPRDLARKLENPHAITLVPRDKFSEKFYDFAYKSYVLNNISKVEFSAPLYSGKNPQEIIPPSELITFLIAAYSAIKKKRDQDLQDLDIRDFIRKYYDKSLIADIEYDFHSPGEITLHTAVAALSIFVALGVAYFTSDASAAELAPNKVTVTNSKFPIDQNAATQEASNDFHYLLNCLGKEKVDNLNKQGKLSKEVGIKTTVKEK